MSAALKGVRTESPDNIETKHAAADGASLTVRPALESDHAPLEFFFDTALRRDYFIRRGQLAELLNGRHHQVYIAEIDDVLVGVAITTRGTRLINALVHPGYRGLGVGRAMVEASGAREVRAKLDMSTGDPSGFYRNIGFQSTGQRNAKGNIEVFTRDPLATPPAAPSPAVRRGNGSASAGRRHATTANGAAGCPRSPAARAANAASRGSTRTAPVTTPGGRDGLRVVESGTGTQRGRRKVRIA